MRNLLFARSLTMLNIYPAGQIMRSAKSDLTTFERSCQHWSQEGRTSMDAFYRLASYDYQLLAEEIDWQAIFRSLQQRHEGPQRLLDVACGSGQFPTALLQYAGIAGESELEIAYALLDPSRFSIETAREKLSPPFVPSEEFCCTAEELSCPEQKYSIVWATHALYCVPPIKLKEALANMLDCSETSGLGFIAHASEQSHYLRFQSLYAEKMYPHLERYASGEQIIDLLENRLQVETLRWTIDYEGTLPLEDRHTAELYLQRCLFDESLSLDQMLNHPALGEYLKNMMDDEAGLWRFPQKVWLLFFGNTKSQVTKR